MDLSFTAGPISDHCPFREAFANQEALQGPIPTTHQSSCIASSLLLPFINALFIAGLLNDVSIIYVNTYIVVNPSDLFLLCFRCDGMRNPYLYVLGYEFPLCILTFQSMCCWIFRNGG